MRRNTPALTADERQRRDRGIIAAYCAGTETSEQIGERFGVSGRHVHNIAARAGIAKPQGRPVALPHAADADLHLYRKFRRHYGAATARQMMEAER